jgi:hypothetical protein
MGHCFVHHDIASEYQRGASTCYGWKPIDVNQHVYRKYKSKNTHHPSPAQHKGNADVVTDMAERTYQNAQSKPVIRANHGRQRLPCCETKRITIWIWGDDLVSIRGHLYLGREMVCREANPCPFDQRAKCICAHLPPLRPIISDPYVRDSLIIWVCRFSGCTSEYGYDGLGCAGRRWYVFFAVFAQAT